MTMLGYSAENCRPSVEWLRELCHPDDVEICDRNLREVLEGTRGTFSGAYCRLRAQDGTWVWVFSSGGVLERGPDGVARRIFCVMFDVTEHKLADEQHRVRRWPLPMPECGNKHEGG
jgi:PAS domain S-box-containing protein